MLSSMLLISQMPWLTSGFTLKTDTLEEMFNVKIFERNPGDGPCDKKHSYLLHGGMPISWPGKKYYTPNHIKGCPSDSRF